MTARAGWRRLWAGLGRRERLLVLALAAFVLAWACSRPGPPDAPRGGRPDPVWAASLAKLRANFHRLPGEQLRESLGSAVRGSDPRASEALLRLGRLSAARGEVALALACYQDLHLAHPRSATGMRACLERAHLLRREGHRRQARDCYARVRRSSASREQDREAARYFLARMDCDAGQHAQACRAWSGLERGGRLQRWVRSAARARAACRARHAPRDSSH